MAIGIDRPPTQAARNRDTAVPVPQPPSPAKKKKHTQVVSVSRIKDIRAHMRGLKRQFKGSLRITRQFKGSFRAERAARTRLRHLRRLVEKDTGEGEPVELI